MSRSISCSVVPSAKEQAGAFIQSNQPKKGICILSGCGGRVVRKIIDDHHGQKYDMPKCEICKRIHFFSDDAPIVP